MITLKFFASLREALHLAEERIDCPPTVRTVGELRRHLAARGGDWERLTTAQNLRCAVNQAMADDAANVRNGDEVAFFPPVTGG